MIPSLLILLAWGCNPTDKDSSSSETDEPTVTDSEDTGTEADDTAPTDGGDDTSDTDDTSPPVDTFEPVVEGLELTEVQLCDAPLAEPSWTDFAETLGVTGPSNPNELRVTDGGAIAIDDLNGDGHYDIVLGYREEAPRVLRWNPDDETYTVQILEAPERPYSIQLADMDGNGWPDLLIAGEGPPAMYLNDGGALTRGVLPGWDTNDMVEELVPGDIDGDGDTDLYVLMATPGDGNGDLRRDFVLWNNGSGGFELDFEAIPGDAGKGVGFDAAFFDADDDGDLDIYLANDHGPCFGPNQLLINDGGSLAPAAECYCDIAMAAMGVDAADWSGDGLPDLVISDHTAWKVLQSVDGRSFVDVSAVVGMSIPAGSPETGWGAIWLDWNNDGDLDVLGAMGINIFSDNDLDNPGDGVILMDYDPEANFFTDIAASKGLEAEDNMRTVVALDYNRDGVLDLFTTPVNHAPRVYLSDGCTAESWVEVFAPPGSRVELTAGDFHRVDWVTAASSLGSATTPMVHFGLGDEDLITNIHVTWPDGSTVAWDKPFEARRRIRAFPTTDGDDAPWR